ncbi:hypothetical protein PPROV_000427900 [Pycnococcus provasolii]|uniref:Inositol polyphosphate-related phosphatase domain-containing protein n=2 Tax=Pycnococcus provasolii TaxID=41880 RepID=A0A830HJR2_9CHLO|nr:hypothetical protein PPROV_000427900 [Pycnococcus provasolii]
MSAPWLTASYLSEVLRSCCGPVMGGGGVACVSSASFAALLRSTGLPPVSLARIWDAMLAHQSANTPHASASSDVVTREQVAVALQMVAACQAGMVLPGLLPPPHSSPIPPPTWTQQQASPVSTPTPTPTPQYVLPIAASPPQSQSPTKTPADPFAELAALSSPPKPQHASPPMTSMKVANLQQQLGQMHVGAASYVAPTAPIATPASNSFLSAEVLAAGEAAASSAVPARRTSNSDVPPQSCSFVEAAQSHVGANDAPLLDLGGLDTLDWNARNDSQPTATAIAHTAPPPYSPAAASPTSSSAAASLSSPSFLPSSFLTAPTPQTTPAHGAVLSPAGATSTTTATTRVDLEPLSALLRLSPMLPSHAINPKNAAAPPTMKLAYAGNGALFAFPPGHGGGTAAIHAVARSWPRLSELASSPPARVEAACSDDGDMAPSSLVQGSLGRSMAMVTSVCIDSREGFLWTGHDDGVVTAWHMGGTKPVPSAQTRVHNSRVTALCICHGVSGGGAYDQTYLVTGSSSGTLRRWGTRTFISTFAQSFGKLQLDASASTELQPTVHAEIRHAVHSGCDGDRCIAWFAGEFSISCWDVSRCRLLLKFGAASGPGADLSSPDAAWQAADGANDDAYFDGADEIAVGSSAGQSRGFAGALAQKIARSKLGKYAARGARGAVSSAVSGIAAVARATGAGSEMAGAAQAHQANLRARMRKRVAALCSGGKGGSAWIVYEGAYASLVGCDGRAILNTDDGPAGITHNDDHPMAGGALFQCACFVPGSGRQPDSLWVGTSAGRVRVYNASTGSLCTILIDGVGSGVIRSMACGPDVVAGLSSSGAVRVWGQQIVLNATRAAALRQALCTSPAVPFRARHTCRIFCGTWNVNERKPSLEHIVAWLRGGYTPNAALAAQPAYDLAVFGLQEIEMSTSTVAAASLMESVGGVATAPAEDEARGFARADALFPDVNSLGTVAQWWANQLREGLNAYTKAMNTSPGQSSSWTSNPVHGGGSGSISSGGYRLAACRALGPSAIFVFARIDVARFVGEVETCAVPCGGPGGMMANKGGVACRLTLYRRSIVFVNSHMAAHQDKVAERNAHYERIASQMHFHGTPQFESQSSDVGDPFTSEAPALQNLDGGAMWLGDFNYRVNHDYDRARELAIKGSLDELLSREQLAMEMQKGSAFRGFTEGPVRFRPTFKFDSCTYKEKKGKGDNSEGPTVRAHRTSTVSSTGSSRWDIEDDPSDANGNEKDPLVYDLSEKRRVPSWCDRVLFRGAIPEKSPTSSERGASAAVTGSVAEWVQFGVEDSKVNRDSSAKTLSETVQGSPVVEVYDGLTEICQSDHKPVLCVLNYTIESDSTRERFAAWYDEIVKSRR